MAEVTLYRPDREGAVLPDVCVMCGRLASGRTRLRLPLVPPLSIAFLVLFCLVLLVTAPVELTAAAVIVFAAWQRFVKRKTFGVPLCPAHSPRLSLALRLNLLAAVAFLSVGTIAFVADPRNVERIRNPPRDPFAAPAPEEGVSRDVVIVCLVGFVAILFAGASLYAEHRPRARQVTDDTINLAGVSPVFVRAYLESLMTFVVPPDATTYWHPPAVIPRRTPVADASDGVRPENEV